MHTGLWHQLGDRSQLLAREQLTIRGLGGVILSPRDLSKQNAEKYGRDYQSLGAEVIFDPQFYIPQHLVGKQNTYEDLIDFRISVSRLAENSATEFRLLSRKLRTLTQQLSCTAIMAPAVAMDAGQPDQLKVNLALLDAAIATGSTLQLPVYGVIPVGESLALSENELADVLSGFTTRDVDGWILMMDLGSDGFCRSVHHASPLCRSVLRLAQSGKPVMHGCAGANCLLSLACGANAFGMTHSKNMWRLPLSRFEPKEGGGGGAAPTRLFSGALWSTLVFPDELVQLPRRLRAMILETSEWVNINPNDRQYYPAAISQWDAYKHLLHVVESVAGNILLQPSIVSRFQSVVDHLESAQILFSQIQSYYEPKDMASGHHQAWLDVLAQTRADRHADFDYIDLISE